MSEVDPGLSRRKPKKFRSEKEKRFYYDTWKASGLSKHEFCQQHNLPDGTFYAWCHHFDKAVSSVDDASAFSPVGIVDNVASEVEAIPIELTLGNGIRIRLSFREDRLTPFLQELMNATSIIR